MCHFFFTNYAYLFCIVSILSDIFGGTPQISLPDATVFGALMHRGIGGAAWKLSCGQRVSRPYLARSRRRFEYFLLNKYSHSFPHFTIYFHFHFHFLSFYLFPSLLQMSSAASKSSFDSLSDLEGEFMLNMCDNITRGSYSNDNKRYSRKSVIGSPCFMSMP